MKNKDLYSSLFWLTVGIGIALSSIKYRLGTLEQPGPGFTTLIAGVLLIFFSAILFISSISRRESQDAFRGLWAGVDLRAVLVVLILLIMYMFVLELLGFLFSTFIFLFFIIKLKSSYRIWIIILTSAFIACCFYLVFKILLQVELPKGILG